MAHDQEQYNNAIYTELWSVVEGCSWSFHAPEKPSIEDDYTFAVVESNHSIQKFSTYITYNNSGSSLYPTLETHHQYNHITEDSSSFNLE